MEQQSNQQPKYWYVVRAISGKEQKAKEYIEGKIKELKWEGRVLQVLVPTEKVVVARNGKKVIKERNTFPGYILIETTMRVPPAKKSSVRGQRIASSAGAQISDEERSQMELEMAEQIERDKFDAFVSVVQNLPNVIDFLRENDHRPTPMRQSEVSRILGDMDAQKDGAANAQETFLVGEPVKITDGPFTSFAGVVEEVNAEKQKLKVTVKIFGRKTPLELGYNQVEKE
jgi:transcriptional antiterminator NusG